jgi:hypothetical protein
MENTSEICVPYARSSSKLGIVYLDLDLSCVALATKYHKLMHNLLIKLTLHSLITLVSVRE